MPRVAQRFLEELIESQGQLSTGPVTSHCTLRLALDLREARERIVELERQLAFKNSSPRPSQPVSEIVRKAGRFGRVVEEVPASKIDYRA